MLEFGGYAIATALGRLGGVGHLDPFIIRERHGDRLEDVVMPYAPELVAAEGDDLVASVIEGQITRPPGDTHPALLVTVVDRHGHEGVVMQPYGRDISGRHVLYADRTFIGDLEGWNADYWLKRGISAVTDGLSEPG